VPLAGVAPGCRLRPERCAVSDHGAQDRLADWRAADRAETETADGSNERRRAHSATRRARWRFEDAARQAGEDHGICEPRDRFVRRALHRLAEANETSSHLHRDIPAARRVETPDERDARVAHEDEIAQELGEDGR
jgi:hypothetical protein